MFRNAEKVEDDVRQRVQDAKDEIWEEFSAQINTLSSSLTAATESLKIKDDQIQQLFAIIEKDNQERALIMRDLAELKNLLTRDADKQVEKKVEEEENEFDRM